MNKKYITIIVSVFTIICIFVLIGYFYTANTQKDSRIVLDQNTNTDTNLDSTLNTNSTTEEQVNNNVIDTSDWKTYESKNLHYSIKYPNDFNQGNLVGTYYKNNLNDGVYFNDRQNDYFIYLFDKNWFTFGSDLGDTKIIDFNLLDIKLMSDITNINELANGTRVNLNKVFIYKLIKNYSDTNTVKYYYFVQNPITNNIMVLSIYEFFGENKINDREKLLLKMISTLQFIK